jgi:hypothetical protein
MATTTPVFRSNNSLSALLTLALLAALSGCGPAPSDQAANLESRASAASDNGTGTARGLSPFPSATVPFPGAEPVPLSAQPRAPRLVIPDWIANDLASPDAQVRLKAVEIWGQSAPSGAVDPLIQALEDQDEQVQARALELIVQDWASAQAARSEASP